MKKIIVILFFLFWLFQSCFVFWVETVGQSDLMIWQWTTLFKIWPNDKVNLDLGVDKEDVSLKHFLSAWQRYILGIVWLVALWMFLYIWFELATAEWKQDQFTKWMKALIYLVVWLAVIPLSYVIVKVATWFSF